MCHKGNEGLSTNIFHGRNDPGVWCYQAFKRKMVGWTDGACITRWAGIKLVLQDPEGIKLHYVATLTFIATNNIAEYEVVVMTLRIIKRAGIIHSTIYCDS